MTGTPATLYGGLHVALEDDTQVRHHCEHDDGCDSFELVGIPAGVSVYLTGTPDQVEALAYQLIRVATQARMARSSSTEGAQL